MEDGIQATGACVQPPPLDDVTLLTAVDGEAAPEVMAHLRDCPYCMERARIFADLQGLLSKRLYRALCPSGDELLAYRQGWLEKRRQTFLRDHLSICPHCTADLRMLSEAATTPVLTPPPTAGQRRRLVATRVLPHMRPSPTSMYGAMRGSAHGGQYTYRAENMEIVLDVERAMDNSSRLILFGLLLLDEGMEDVSNSSANLLSEDTVINSALLDEMGNFVLDDITPGDYSLSLHLPDCEVVVEALTL